MKRAIAVFAMVACWGSLVAAPRSVEGCWRLVEQTYGSGRANLAGGPLHLEFYRVGNRLEGRTWVGEDRDGASPWPAAPDGVGVQLQEFVTSPGQDWIRARYRTDPAPGEQARLEIVEEYKVVEDGRILTGTVTVKLLRDDGEPGGSYTLRRRFERRP